jgi:hypothetical protein
MAQQYRGASSFVYKPENQTVEKSQKNRPCSLFGKHSITLTQTTTTMGNSQDKNMKLWHEVNKSFSLVVSKMDCFTLLAAVAGLAPLYYLYNSSSFSRCFFVFS